MKRLGWLTLAVMAFLAPVSAAFGQASLLQGGGWQPGHSPMYVGQSGSQPIVQDSGPASGGPIGLGLAEQLLTVRGTGTAPYANAGTGPLGTNWCDYDAPTTNPTGYHVFCISPNAQGGGLISYNAFGGAAPLPFNFNINGTTITPAGGITGVTIGSTTIGNGTSNCIPYDLIGIFQCIPTANSSILATSGSGVPGYATALPNGITATTQAFGDSSTKVATDAFVLAAALNVYTPEQYYQSGDGSNWGPALNRAMVALNALPNGGTLQLGCGTTYAISTVSSDGMSAVHLLSNVNIRGCGDSSVIQIANGVNTSSSFFIWGLYTPGTANNVRYEKFTIDMNGANNACGGTCWHSNASLGVAIGNDISASYVRFINNPGSNDTVFGQDVGSPTVSNLHLSHLTHEHYGDIVNPASSDFSADFFIAKNVTMDDIIYSDGPRVNGGAFEIHGDGVTASNLVVNDNFNCGIVANEPVTGANTNNIILNGVKCNNVKGGIQIASATGVALNRITVSNVVVNFLAGSSGIAVDACSEMNSASGPNTNLLISNINVSSSVTTSLGNDSFGVEACWWNQINIAGVQTNNTQGGAVLIDNVTSGATITVGDVQATNPGRTSTAGNQVALLVQNTSTNGADSINIWGVTSIGTVLYNISGNVGANITTIDPGSLAANGTIAQWNWTGAGLAGVIFPTGQTNFRATGGTSQFVKQATAGGPLTPTRPVCGDLSNSGTACPANTGTSGATIPLNNGNNNFSGTTTFSGQFISTFGTPTIASGACGTGTNGTISGSNQSGTITIGSATTSSCAVTFGSGPITAPNACLIFPGNATAAAAGTTLAQAGAPSTTGWTFTGSALASTVYRYLCL
jgi:hypothetical protein